MRLNGPSLLAGMALFLAACGTADAQVAQDGSSEPSSSTAAPSTSTTSSAPRCATASGAAVEAVNETVRAKGEGNSVPAAVVWADPDADAWWIVGAFEGPAGEGEGGLGSWATTEDPTQESFDGPIYAIDGGARFSSNAPANTVVDYDPTNVPALGCWHQKKN